MAEFIKDIWAGWLYLLPDLRSKRVLLLFPSGASLVQEVVGQADTVVCITDSGPPEPVIAVSGVDCISLEEISEFSHCSVEFDLIIGFIDVERIAQLELLLNIIPGLLGTTGSVFLQLHNPIRAGVPWWRRVMLSFRYMRFLATAPTALADRPAQNGYAIGFRANQIAAAQMSDRYYPLQNTFRVREKVKRLALYGRLAGIASEGWVGIYGDRGYATPRYLAVVSRAAQLAGFSDYQLTNVLVLNQACILLLNSTGSVSGLGVEESLYGAVAVICCSDFMYHRRRRELSLLTKLRARYPDLRSALSKPLGSELTGNLAVCYQERMKGVTIEADFAGLTDATGQAAGFLERLVGQGGKSIVIDIAELDRTLSPLVARAVERTPAYQTELMECAELLRQKLLGKVMRHVVMHGDFKIENVMFSEKDLQLQAVIDWDLGDENGYPFLDLWYLLIYNRQIRRQQNFFEAYVEMLLSGQLSVEEERLINSYSKRISLDPELVIYFKGLFLFFHIGNRSNLKGAAFNQLKGLERAITELKTKLGPVSGPC